jgi:endoglucanase
MRSTTLRALAGALTLFCAISIAIYYSDNEPPNSQDFVQADGRRLVQNGSPVRLKSVSFSNYYEHNIGENGFDPRSSRHHSEKDFRRVSDLGFNSVRFAINGNWYQQDPRRFWLWLDQNVAWAKQHGVMLTLDLHIPIGGFWLAPNAPNVDFSIWTDAAVRQKNVELWRKIAERYKDEPTIAAFELLNEAVTTDSTGEQWRKLASEMVAAIRDVNQNHLLIVGATYGTNKKFSEMGRGSQFLVDDTNVMYDFHFYQPIEYTHQNASWVDPPMKNGGSYPDYDKPIPTGDQVLISGENVSTKVLQEGDSDWTKYESGWVRLDDPDAKAALPILVVRSGARGAVEFDDIEVFEFSSSSRQVTKVVSAPLTKEGVWQWWAWGDADQEKSPSVFTRSQSSGANDRHSLAIDGVTTQDSYLGWSSDRHWFNVTAGNLYKVSGYMKGSDIVYFDNALTGEAFIGVALNFYKDPRAPRTEGFIYRDREFLEREFLKMYNFGIENNVPMSVMEFGVMRDTFGVDGKGGEKWVGDMLDIFSEYDVSFSFWNYHGSSMGLYLSDYGSEPGEPNLELARVFEEKLLARRTPTPNSKLLNVVMPTGAAQNFGGREACPGPYECSAASAP